MNEIFRYGLREQNHMQIVGIINAARNVQVKRGSRIKEFSVENETLVGWLLEGGYLL